MSRCNGSYLQTAVENGGTDDLEVLLADADARALPLKAGSLGGDSTCDSASATWLVDQTGARSQSGMSSVAPMTRHVLASAIHSELRLSCTAV
jgi:hypothetical protein